MNNVKFLSLAIRRSGFHDKKGTNRDIYRLNDDHIGERDKFCTYQAIDPRDDGR